MLTLDFTFDSRSYRRALSILAVCCAVIGQSFVPYTAEAKTASYDEIVAQLSDFVAQRTAALAELNAVDGEVGAAVVRDVLAALQPSVDRQAALFRQTQVRLARVAPAPRPPEMFGDRSIAPGTLEGAHMPAPLPASTPQSVVPPGSPAWKASLLGASAVQIAPAIQPISTVPRLAAVQTAHDDSRVEAGLAAAPTAFAALGSAMDAGQPREVELNGRASSITGVAPQVVLTPSASVASSTAIPPAEVPAHGTRALAAMVGSSQVLASLLNGVAVPGRLSSVSLLASQPITRMSDVMSSLAHYSLRAAGRVRQASSQSTPPVLKSPVAVTWAYTETAALGKGTTLLTIGAASGDGDTLQSGTVSAYTLMAPSPSVPAATSVTISLRSGGQGLLQAVVPLTGTASLTATALVPGLLRDDTIRDGLQREAHLLAQLDSILAGGNAAYDAVEPLYQARLARFNATLSAAVSHNSILEQAFWDRTNAWAAYQAQLTTWQKRDSVWTSYLQRRIGSSSRTPRRAAAGRRPHEAARTKGSRHSNADVCANETPLPIGALHSTAIASATLLPIATCVPAGAHAVSTPAPSRPTPTATLTPVARVPSKLTSSAALSAVVLRRSLLRGLPDAPGMDAGDSLNVETTGYASRLTYQTDPAPGTPSPIPSPLDLVPAATESVTPAVLSALKPATQPFDTATPTVAESPLSPESSPPATSTVALTPSPTSTVVPENSPTATRATAN